MTDSNNCFELNISSKKFCFPKDKLKLINSGQHVAAFYFTPDGYPDTRKPIRILLRNDWELVQSMASRDQTRGEVAVYGRIPMKEIFSNQVENALELLKLRVSDKTNQGKFIRYDDLLGLDKDTTYDNWIRYIVPENGRIVRYIILKPSNKIWKYIGDYTSNWPNKTFTVIFSYYDNTLSSHKEFKDKLVLFDNEFRQILSNSEVK